MSLVHIINFMLLAEVTLIMILKWNDIIKSSVLCKNIKWNVMQIHLHGPQPISKGKDNIILVFALPCLQHISDTDLHGVQCQSRAIGEHLTFNLKPRWRETYLSEWIEGVFIEKGNQLINVLIYSFNVSFQNTMLLIGYWESEKGK